MIAQDDSFETVSEAAALAAFGELIGADTAESLWTMCARSLGLHRPVDKPADIRRMADHFIEIAHLTRVAARSVKVRAITYEAMGRAVPS